MFQTLLCTCLSINAPCGTTCSHLHCLFVYQRDRAWHAFASCTDLIVGMITVAASHMSFSCIDSETDAPMRSIVSRLGAYIYAYMHISMPYLTRRRRRRRKRRVCCLLSECRPWARIAALNDKWALGLRS